MNYTKKMAKAEIFVRGRMFNFLPAHARRNLRDRVIADVSERYLQRFLPVLEGVADTTVIEPQKPEKVFTLWLQGEENAPPLVKACARSMRHNFSEQQFTMLDEHSIYDYIELPGVIMDKRRQGKIGHAHFSDIVRVELLHEHGGYWLDATGFATSPIPKWIEKQDFFAYLSSISILRPHTFMENSFIHAKKGAWLLEGWRALMLDYWAREDGPLTYFMHQLLFKMMVQKDPRGREHFARMVQANVLPTHMVWWGYGKKPFDEELFKELTADACWQKTAHNSKWTANPPAGSVADEMINRMYL